MRAGSQIAVQPSQYELHQEQAYQRLRQHVAAVVEQGVAPDLHSLGSELREVDASGSEVTEEPQHVSEKDAGNDQPPG